MKFEVFKKSLENGIKPAYYIFGDDIFLMYRSLEFLVNASVPTYPDLNYNTFTLDSKESVDEILNSLDGLPFGDIKRLVVMKGSNLKKNEANLKKFTSYLDNPNKDSCFVYFETAPNELFATLKQKFETIDCSALTRDRAKQFVANELNKKGQTIENDAFNLLCDNCDGLLSKMLGELKKLSVLSGGTITVQLVFDNTEKTLEYQVFELSDALAKRQKERALHIFEKLILERETRESIIPVLEGQFSRAMHAKLCSDNELLSRELKVKEYAIIKSRELAKNFSQKQLKEIVDLLLSYEHMHKSGKVSLDNALLNLIDKILLIIS